MKAINVAAPRTLSDLKEKEFYQMNIGDNATKKIIQLAKEKLATVQLLQERFLPGLEVKKKIYEEAKYQYTEMAKELQSYDDDIKELNGIVNAMTVYGAVEDRNKKIARVVNKDDIPEIDRDINVHWIRETEKVLQIEKRFLDLEQLWKLFSEDKELVEKANLNQVKFAGSKSAALDGIVKHAFRAANHSTATKNQILCVYKELIGLYDWVDNQGVPRGDYIKQFMFSDGTLPNDARVKKLRPYEGESIAS